MNGLEIGILCLALNIYFEARGESDVGQIAVTHVVLNRSKIKKRSLCEEVYSPYQFSWTNGINLPPIPNSRAWIDVQYNAQLAYQKPDPTGGALWYHRHDISPWWVWNKTVTKRIGNHIFYKCKKGYQCDWN